MTHTKRRHGRVRAPGVSTNVHTGGKARSGCTADNLSLGGAFIRTFEPVAIGSRIVLVLSRPGLKKEIHLDGSVTSVVRADEATERRLTPGMGVAFAPYADEVHGQLRELLLLLAPGSAALDGDHVGHGVPRPDSAPSPRPLSERAAAISGLTSGGNLGFEPEEAVPTPRPQHVVHVAAMPAQSVNEARLALDLTLLQSALADSEAENRKLEGENQKLREEVGQVRRALFQLKHR